MKLGGFIQIITLVICMTSGIVAAAHQVHRPAARQCLLAKLGPEFHKGTWYEIANTNRGKKPCVCSKYELSNQGNAIQLQSYCVTPSHALITQTSTMQVNNCQFNILTDGFKSSKFVVDADLKEKKWIVFSEGNGNHITILSRDPLLRVRDILKVSNAFDTSSLRRMDTRQCIVSAHSKSSRRLLVQVSNAGGELVGFNEAHASAAQSGGKACPKPEIKRGRKEDIVKSDFAPTFYLTINNTESSSEKTFIPYSVTETATNTSEASVTDTSSKSDGINILKAPVLGETQNAKTISRPSCTWTLDGPTTISQNKKTHEIIYTSIDHETWTVQDQAIIDAKPLAEVKCAGRFKAINRELTVTVEEYKEITRKIEDHEKIDRSQQIVYKPLSRPSCTYRIDDATSVTQNSKTHEIIYTSSEKATWTVQEQDLSGNKPLTKVSCVGRFKNIDQEIDVVSEQYREVTRTITDNEHIDTTKKVVYKPLTQPSCTYRLEDVTSVTQNNKTHEIIYTSSEHETWTVPVVEIKEAKPLGKTRCKGKFESITQDLEVISEEIREVTRTITDVDENDKTKKIVYKALQPPTCTYRIEDATSVTQNSKTHEIIYTSSEHATWTVQEQVVDGYKPLEKVRCMGRFKSVDQELTITEEEYKEVTRKIEDHERIDRTNQIVYKPLSAPTCTYRIEDVTSVTQNKITHEIVFTSSEHATWSVPDLDYARSKPLEKVRCMGKFKAIAKELTITEEEYKEVTRMIEDHEKVNRTQQIVYKPLSAPSCTYRLEDVTSVTQNNKTHEIIYTSSEHATWIVPEQDWNDFKPLDKVMCIGKFKSIYEEIEYLGEDQIREISRRIVDHDISTITTRKVYSPLVEPKCESQITQMAEFEFEEDSLTNVFTAADSQVWELPPSEYKNKMSEIECQGKFSDLGKPVAEPEEMTKSSTVQVAVIEGQSVGAFSEGIAINNDDVNLARVRAVSYEADLRSFEQPESPLAEEVVTP